MSVTGRQTVWEGKFLRAVTLDFEYQSRMSGRRLAGKWEAFERVDCHGVVGIVPITDDGCILLVRQFRPPVGGLVVELPAGLVNEGESFEAAAKRELEEETGYRAKRMDFLVRGPMSSGASAETLDVFVATGLTFVGAGSPDETEDIEVFKVPIGRLRDKLDEFSKAGNHIDLKIHGMIELAKAHTGKDDD